MKKSIHLAIAFVLTCGMAVAQKSVQNEVNSFVASTGAKITIDKATNRPNFIRFATDSPVSFTGDNSQQNIETFISSNAGVLGIDPKQDVYVESKSSTDSYQMEHITKQQTYFGVPVFGGLLNFHLKNKNLISLNGNIIAEIKVNPIPTISAEDANNLALDKMRGDLLSGGIPNLKVKNNNLYIFQVGLVDGNPGPKILVYRIEISDDAQIREYLFIDAHTGELVDQLSGTHSALDRKLYQPTYSAAAPATNLLWKEGDVFPGTLDQWQQSEIESAGQIYNLMKNAFGRISYDNADATMITTNNNPSISCPNANWNGTSANYCTNVAADDVVAHEWAHAYTEYTSGLVYAWQSGAMNEAYSDIWGETVDLLNNYFDSGEGTALRATTGNDCPTVAVTTRWKMGEQATAFSGSIRDMYNPNCNSHPGRVMDPFYYCASRPLSNSNDYGGVHRNSGVINHAYALLVDGGTYNGQTITGIGLIKAAHIFWRAQSFYLTPTSDFANFADILPLAANDMLGIDLQGLSTTTPLGASGQIIDNNDILELNKVILAVELTMDNNCQFQTWVQPAPALCEGASPSLALLYEDFEGGLNGFTVSHTTTSGTFTNRDWVVAEPKDGHVGKAAFGINLEGGDCTSISENGVLHLDSPVLNFPMGASGNVLVSFDHMIASEEMYDGGNVKYKINGGAWTLVPASAFTANPYNGTLRPSSGSDNPLAGQAAFLGTENGTNTTTWAQSQINLTSLGITTADQLQLRWDFGSDCGYGIKGWYVDNVRVFTCAVTPAVHFVKGTTVINESQANITDGCLNYIDVPVTIQIDKAPSQPVNVTVSTTGSAKMGSNGDFTVSSNMVTLSSGQLSQNLMVRIYNDANIEGAEDIVLTYSINNNGGDAFAAAELQTHTLTIIDDDLTPGNYTDEILSSKFNNSYNYWTVKNGGTTEDSWRNVTYSDAALDNSGRPFFFINSNALGSNLVDEIMESPVMNTAGKKNLKLSFSQDWNPKVNTFNEQGTVDVWDGTQWQNLLTQQESTGRLGSISTTTPNLQNLTIPDGYANTQMKIRFHYVAYNDNWWGIDNVKVTASNSTDIQTVVNTGVADTQYLGPNETVAFYDPTTRNIMAKIENLSNHDYGCTTVEIDRSGLDDTNWFGSYNITNKTVKVTPTTNNATGQYKITLYFKTSELPNFNGVSIKSMGKSAGAIGSANSGNSSWAEVSAQSVFNTDLSFTATFDSGFSGFGLSTAPPVGPLPVQLISFNGENTNEGNLLTWITSEEINSDYFVIERSGDGKVFVQLDKIKGMGNTSGLSEYHYTDGNNLKGLNYYRLKQFDLDGSYGYSRMISINAANASHLKSYPNPVHSVLSLEIPEHNLSVAELTLVNTAGIEIMKNVLVSVKNGVVTSDLSRLVPGIYQVIIRSEKATYHSKIMKN